MTLQSEVHLQSVSEEKVPKVLKSLNALYEVFTIMLNLLTHLAFITGGDRFLQVPAHQVLRKPLRISEEA